MNLDELRAVQDREREKDSLQHLRDSFYEEIGTYVADLQAERERRADQAEDPFADPEVRRLTDEIETAEEVAESIYERRMGKVVKTASLAAAGYTADTDGLTEEEAALFDDLVERIEANQEAVLDVLSGMHGGSAGTDSGVAGGERDGAARDGRGGAAGDGRDGAAGDGRDGAAGDGAADPTRGEGRGRATADDGASAPDAGGDTAPPGDDPASDAEAAGDADADVAPSADPGAGDSAPEPSASTAADAAGGTTADSSTAVSADSADASAADEPDAPGEPPLPSEDGRPEAEADAAASEAAGGFDAAAAMGDPDRVTVRITEDVGEIVGVDGTAYDLAPDDVVTLPEANAMPLLEKEAATRVE